MVVLHFLKREFETLFVHHFSADTMPVLYIFRNSAHYWALSGLVFGYIVYHPAFSHTQRTNTQAILALILYTYAELSNLYTHVTLRNLRPVGSRVRKVPHGYGFDWPFGGISCANYFFEIMAWVVIAVWSGCWGVLPFLATALYIMDRWAQTVWRHFRVGLCLLICRDIVATRRNFPIIRRELLLCRLLGSLYDGGLEGMCYGTNTFVGLLRTHSFVA
jgi:very-long-chain enoyl-CoA reductase